MSYLGVVLDKVRQSDLAQFREKVLAMEKGKKEELEAQGLMNIDMVVQANQNKAINERAGMIKAKIDAETATEKKVEVQEASEDKDVFAKFLQNIRG